MLIGCPVFYLLHAIPSYLASSVRNSGVPFPLLAFAFDVMDGATARRPPWWYRIF